MGWFANMLQVPLGNAFVQFRMDDLGRHEYICMREVQERAQESSGPGGQIVPLTIVYEDEVKAMRQQHSDLVVVLNTSQSEDESAKPASEQAVADLELCPPRTVFRNYSVCEDLTLGPTQRIMLSDENTLRMGVERNGVKIFNHLTLIVNCHETAAANKPGKYSVGTARPSLLFQPIHELMSARLDVIVQAMDRIQQRIWECSQEGSVAVHCLAGIHRAPTVVVCQYLYRHYVLGQTDVCCDVETIYSRLKRVRPNVEPLGYIRLIKMYETYLRSNHKPEASAPGAPVPGPPAPVDFGSRHVPL
jgi:hypothetical protein